MSEPRVIQLLVTLELPESSNSSTKNILDSVTTDIEHNVYARFGTTLVQLVRIDGGVFEDTITEIDAITGRDKQ